MVAACVDLLPLYRPRDPQASDLWRLLEQYFETFQQVYLPAGRQVTSGLRPSTVSGARSSSAR
jgi:hypothetical protein